MTQTHRQKGLPCPCGKGSLVPVFTYTGDNYTLMRIPGLGYCKTCTKVYRVAVEEVQ